MSYTEVWEVWQTKGDNRVCVNCARLYGEIFLRGTGPQAPLHPECRCKRIPHHTRHIDIMPPIIPIVRVIPIEEEEEEEE